MDQPNGFVVSNITDALRSLRFPEEMVQLILGLINLHIASQLHQDQGPPLTTAETARALQKFSLRRAQHLGPKLAADTSWNMLLDLYASHAEGHRISVTSLCIASGGAPTTALRQIGLMEKHRLIARSNDATDHRRVWVDPTDATLELMQTLLEGLRLTGAGPSATPLPAS